MHLYLLASVSPYPNSALSAGELALIAIVPVVTLVAWLVFVFAADRQRRHHGAAGTTPVPRQPSAREQVPAQRASHEQAEREAA